MLSRFVLLAIVIAASSVRAEPTKLHDTDLAIDTTAVAAGAWTTAVVTTWAALDPTTREPLPDAVVTAWVVASDAKTDVIPSDAVVTKTGSDGNAIVRVRAPSAAGSYKLVIDTRSRWGSDRLVRSLTTVERRLLLLRTDRTWHQPGQAVRWRTTLLDATDAHPVAEAEVALELRDARGTLLWRERAHADAHGMASGTIPMSPSTIGNLAITATAGTASASETLEFRRADLPKMVVTIDSDPPANDRIKGVVSVRYPYGEPVRGTINLVVDRQSKNGELDANGRYAFDSPISGRDKVVIQATVHDRAMQFAEARKEIARPAERFVLAIVAARERFHKGEPVALTLITTDGNGVFVPAQLTLTTTRGRVANRLELSPGVIRIEALGDDAGMLELAVLAEGGGKRTSESITLGADRDRDPDIDVDDVLVAAGTPIQIHGHWNNAKSPVAITLLRAGSALAATTATVVNGELSATLTPPPGVFGLCLLRAAAATWEMHTRSQVVVTEQLVYLVPATLDVTVLGAGRFAPGTTPTLTVSVKDANGTPVPNVGLAASVIDERALLLSKQRIDVADVLRALAIDRNVKVPSLLARGEDLAQVFTRLLGTATPEARLAARAIVERMSSYPMPKPTITIEAEERFRAERDRVVATMMRAMARLDSPAPAFVEVAGKWQPRAEVAVLLEEAARPESERVTPWALPISWDYVQKLDDRWTPTHVGEVLVERRLEALASALTGSGGSEKPNRRRMFLASPKTAMGDLVARGELLAHLTNDPWGHAIEVEVIREHDPGRGRVVRLVQLRSCGPDGVCDNGDDAIRRDVFADFVGRRTRGGSGIGYTGDGNGGGGYGDGRRLGGMGEIERLAVVRQRFDETVLWATGIATGPRGDATVDVPLADSVTGWEMQVDAVSPEGAVGTVKTRLETFLPLHLAAVAPTRLIVGDSTVLQVVISNHSGRARVLNLIASGSPALGIDTAKSASNDALKLEDGDVTSISLALAAIAAGTGKVRLALIEDAKEVDAIELTVPIETLGQRVELARTTRAKDGIVSFPIEVPETIAAGSAKGRIALYRGLADLSSDGLEDMIKEPHGCFEQTSSTTHPNVMLLELLGSEPRFEAARKRARDYITMGYQRLVSYEVVGEPGGFSIFGQAPASRTLTAYGLIEFSDIAHVYDIDPNLLTRIRAYLAKLQKSDGSWDPDGHGDRFAATAFIAWALAESSAGAMTASGAKALDYLERNRAAVTDPYAIALWANAEVLAKRAPVAGPKLAAFAVPAAGGLSYAAPADYESMMYARGTGATVQLTALAAMWHARSHADTEARSAMSWLWEARGKLFGWGSTHGTMLALRAARIVFDSKAIALPEGLTVMVDGQPVGRIYDADGVPSLDLALTPGAHLVSVALPNGFDGLQAGLALEWRTNAAPDALANGLAVTNERIGDAPATWKMGARIGMSLTVTNQGDAMVSMPTIVVPIPSGLRVQSWQMRSPDEARIAKVDDLGSELHIYLTSIAPHEALELTYYLEASVPCDLTQRPVEVFAYYDPTIRGASAQGRIEVPPP